MDLQKILLALVALIIGSLFLRKEFRNLIYILYRTLPRDLLGTYRFLKVNLILWWWEKREMTVAKIFSNHAAKHPKEIAYIFEDKEYSYQQLEEFSNRVGRYFRTRPYSRGDTVALFMESRPEYVGTWLGLSKAGFVAALVNTNLRHESLIHSIRTANCKALIFHSELKDAVRDVKEKISDVELYQWSEVDDAPLLEGTVDLNKEMMSVGPEPLLVDMSLGNPRDKLIYIYTSGTTGLPKAAVINNLRYMLLVLGVYTMLGLKKTDRLYDSLPLYHSAGGAIGAGQALLKGITVVLRRRFSASKFWPDCVHYQCTAAQYIGEICRYLLAVPPSSYDTSHKVRLMFGNGLRPQIWRSFTERFKIGKIGEFYGATEGNSNLINIDNRIGAVGFMPRYARNFYPVALIKVDKETGKPLRGADGLCIPCEPNEPGVFVGKINPKKTVNDFCGYADKKSSEAKIIYDVFKKGDRVFNSGDILVMDKLGYFYFKDRTGDTFRWRGENVATSEVEAVVSNAINLKDAVVYGVEIPGSEGRAGMVSIYDPDNTLNLKQLEAGIKKSLPTYARPLFVRVLSSLPVTGTYKLKKTDLQKEGFDIRTVKDPIYFLDNKSGEYIKLTDELFQNILQEKVRI
ncbi:long-chain fatty acid transport protein 4-like [Prorops nasuta]|uniref:long-chain fatty acid transport protein 4-like n=1 Tax=Prorops nasuta TaxID=863751 RepID=UPI0034CF9A7B